MMPGVSGYDVCREIRRTDPAVPVIFISAKSEEIDKVVGLELGADDFIVKPFGGKESSPASGPSPAAALQRRPREFVRRHSASGISTCFHPSCVHDGARLPSN